ncbi:hypothetical protein GE061_014109 [Apolygus lucorum]|uniref:Uncharacterized protein n=1 Tax=Apolygus lucorum TaxID=248454 RepID=A0A8S9XSD8_APOLU|nr:hypothetical protein GE061_014109 [Apolygus lucorum]
MYSPAICPQPTGISKSLGRMMKLILPQKFQVVLKDVIKRRMPPLETSLSGQEAKTLFFPCHFKRYRMQIITIE